LEDGLKLKHNKLDGKLKEKINEEQTKKLLKTLKHDGRTFQINLDKEIIHETYDY